MRKCFLLLLTACCLLSGLSPAHAETAFDGMALPDGAMFIADEYPFQVNTFTPLPDGAVLAAGYLTYEGKERIVENIGFEDPRDAQPFDAYALCLGADGQTQWKLRLADSHAFNGFYCQGIQPDGRLLLTFGSSDESAFGSQHFIVGQDGIVEGLVSTRELAKHFAPKTLSLVADGYIGGGRAPVDEIFGEDFPMDITLLDFDLSVQWQYQPKTTQMWPAEVIRGADGYFISDMYMNDMQDAFALSLVKLDETGEFLWEFTEDLSEGPLAYISAMLPQEDGGILLAGSYTPEHIRKSEYALCPALTMLGADGSLLWSWPYEDEPFVTIADAVPFGEGYLLSTKLDDDNMIHEYALCYVGKDGKPLAEPMLINGGKDYSLPMVPGLAVAGDGTVYVHGNIHGPLDWDERRDGPHLGFYYATLTPDDFT